MSATPSKFVWYDLMTSDTQAAESFYPKVVGWEATDSGMPDRPYTLFSVGPTMIGGLMPIAEEARVLGARPGWMGYIGVADVDVTAARVQAAGGVLHRPRVNIPGIGRFAVAADPHGAAFILFKGASAQTPVQAAPATPGHIAWHELHAGDGESAFAFYSSLFGWTQAEAIDMGPMGTYQTFAMGGDAVGGMMTKMPDLPLAMRLYYFNVDAIDNAMARVTQNGGKVSTGPHQVPTGQWILQCLDPQRAMFALLAAKR